MKRHSPAEAGIGFMLLVAAATFVIAVVAGIFLIYQSETTMGSNTQLRALAQAETPVVANRRPDSPDEVIPPSASIPP